MELGDELCFCSGFVKALKEAAMCVCHAVTLFLCRKHAIVIALFFFNPEGKLWQVLLETCYTTVNVIF